MKKLVLIGACVALLASCSQQKQERNMDNQKQELELTQEWDKVFPQSKNVDHK